MKIVERQEQQIKAVSQHAVDRYMERSGCKKEVKAINTLFRLADSAIRLGGDRYYSKGWVVVHRCGEVKTVFRPKSKQELAAIHSACQLDELDVNSSVDDDE